MAGLVGNEREALQARVFLQKWFSGKIRPLQFVTLVLWRRPELRRGSARLTDYCRSKTDRVLTVVPSGLLIT